MDDAQLAAVDDVLTTTRAVRRRLDLERPVPDEVLWRCIDIAEQAPSGSGTASRRWLVIRDPEVKAAVAGLYRSAGGAGIAARAAQMERPSAILQSAAHLVDNMERVPVLVLVCIWGVHDGSGNPGLFDSVIQSAWSFCLALRARGLGSSWTTMHLRERDAMAEVLGIPAGVSQIVLLPVAYTIGTDFQPVSRRPAAEITYLDRWGHTAERPSPDGRHHLDLGPGYTVETDVAAPRSAVWAFASDIAVPARFSGELQRAEWLDGDVPGPGARFVGHNHIDGFGTWQTTSHVVAWEPNRRFAWAVSDPDRPGATWSFELEALGLAGEHTRLRHHMVIGPGFSGTRAMIEREPEREQQVLAWRRRALRVTMQRTIDGIKALAEGREPEDPPAPPQP